MPLNLTRSERPAPVGAPRVRRVRNGRATGAVTHTYVEKTSQAWEAEGQGGARLVP